MTHSVEIKIAPGDSGELDGCFVAFVGKLGGVNRREAQAIVREAGGAVVESLDPRANLVVIGAEQLPLADDALLSEPLRQAEQRGQVEIINETEFWERLGLVESQQYLRHLYTPAMLAELLGVPIGIVRRWHRRGLIVPVREVHRLPYFDFQEVASARQLANLLAAGASPAKIEEKLEQLARYMPDVDRPLAQLSVMVEGKQLLLRQGEGLIEPGGQRRFDFEAIEEGEGERTLSTAGHQHESMVDSASRQASILKMRSGGEVDVTAEDANDLLAYATALEDQADLVGAIDAYHTYLLMQGPNADVNFLLAELLYRRGDLTAALERYYAALELDEDYVEARANLGCVLVELGQSELAVAAFEGALARHEDYPDVHYHLARTLEELGRSPDALIHWREFLDLAPDSPWAEEARERLGVTI